MVKAHAKEFFARHFGVPQGHTIYVTDLNDSVGCGKVFDVWSVRHSMGPRGPLRSYMVVDKQNVVQLDINLQDWDAAKHAVEYVPPPSRLEGVSRVLAAEGLLPPKGGADDPAMAPTHSLLMPVPGELCTPDLFKRRGPRIMKDTWTTGGPRAESHSTTSSTASATKRGSASRATHGPWASTS